MFRAYDYFSENGTERLHRTLYQFPKIKEKEENNVVNNNIFKVHTVGFKLYFITNCGIHYNPVDLQ